MTRFQALAAALLLCGASLPARAALEELELPRSAVSAVVAPGARAPEPARLKWAPAEEPVVARTGAAFSICTDGFIRDAKRRAKLRHGDSDHQSGTALTAGRQALDPDVIPYFVLPRHFGRARLGDLALVSYRGRSVWAVAGDRGPCEGCVIGRRHPHRYRFGEGSVALARALGVPGAEDGDRGGIEAGVTFLIFPGSAPREGFGSEAELSRFIAAEGSRIYARRFAAPRSERVAFGR